MLESTKLALGRGLRTRSQAVYRIGNGPPIVWLHGLNGVPADEPFIARLANGREVIAPVAPGFDDLDELLDIRDIHDLALHYDDLLDALDLSTATLIGHSFGAMIAAELAAHFPRRIDRLVLISPIGLWNDAYPVTDVFAVPTTEMPPLLYRTPQTSTNGAAEQDVERLVTLVRGMTTVARFMWPIPDRGLARRLYRVRAPTLVIHGQDDAFVPVQYAHDFAAALADCQTTIVPGGAHMLPGEDPDPVLAAIANFLEARS